jgi:hypothetical protein
MADEIAKTETNEVTPGFVHRKTIDSNNNKLEVRKSERIAKFPKKEALKSPKKVGVKKKNYYNTKLTFSKDPRNPSNIALTAAAITEDVSISDDVSITDDVSISDGVSITDDVSISDNIVSLAPPISYTDVDKKEEIAIDEMVDIEVDETIQVIEEIVSSNDSSDVSEGIILSDENIILLDDPELEMEDVDMLEVISIEEALKEEAAPVMSVAIIEAVDMIKLSALLSV